LLLEKGLVVDDWRESAIATVQVDNEHFIVTEWRFPPGAHTGWHRHRYPYAVVPLTTGQLLLESPSGTEVADLVAGQSYSREAGVEHDVINDGPGEFVFIEIESKPIA
jgi:beta-alanine degradation protein BauB